MNTTHKKLVSQLEEILQKNRDAEKGYQMASENADNPNLKVYFRKKATDRLAFNSSLKSKLVASYDEIDEDGSFRGTVHRAWMDVKSFFSVDNDEAMLEEAIKGDRAALEEYDEVLEHKSLPESIASLLRQQRNQIRMDLNNIKNLENLK